MLAILILYGCIPAPVTEIPTTIQSAATNVALSSTANTDQTFLSAYEFPENIDSSKRYLFYLHGKIVEDQGLHAVSPDYGEYEYESILQELASHDLIVLSEQREPNTDSLEYAGRVVKQIKKLLEAGVPAKNITVAGASKGGAIALAISHLLGNDEINFVILANCDAETVASLVQKEFNLQGNVLTIRDSKDTDFAGSCQKLFDYSEGKGIATYKEIVLHLGLSHGLVYKPLDAWITPLLEFIDNSQSSSGIGDQK